MFCFDPKHPRNKVQKMKRSEEAKALYEERDKAVRTMYEELNKEQKYSQAEIFFLLSKRFFLLERQLYRIVNKK